MNELLDTVFSQPNSNVSENSPLLRHEYTNSSRILTFVVYFCTDWPWETVDYINMQKRGDAQTEDPTTRTPQATGAAATDHNVREEIRTPQATVAAGNGTGIQQNGQPSEESHDVTGVRDNVGEHNVTGLPKVGSCLYRSLIKVMCILFLLFRLSLIAAGAVFQIITCFRRDRISTDFTPIPNTTNTTMMLSCNERSEIICGLLIPNTVILLLACWVYLGLKLGNQYCLRCCGWKELAVVLEIDSAKYLNKLVVAIKPTDKLTKSTTVCYTIISFFYIILSLGVSFFYFFVFDLANKDVVIQPPLFYNDTLAGGKKYWFSAIVFVGFIAFDLLYVQVIMRYAYRCQMIIYFLQLMKENVVTFNSGHNRDQNDPLEESKKAYKFVKYLNASSGTVGFVIIIAAYQAANCAIVLFSNEVSYCQAAAVGLRLILWGFLAVFPFHKAAGVNIASKKLHDVGWDMHRKPLAAPYTSSGHGMRITLKARMFGITVNPWLPYLVVILLLLTIMIGSKFKWYDHVL